uniref:EF-hand domain-containing protein n=1 Tax=Panagrolaimus sp. ES5 TaxID=591445 RepID=A0AC34G8R1_9BILA
MHASYIIAVALVLVPLCSAVCCDRDSITKCCGIGDCNIFCCNCDVGCNPLCNVEIGRKKRESIFEVLVAEHRFKKLDFNDDGVVSMKEALAFLQSSGRNSSKLEEDTEWFSKMDANKNGFVEPSEFDRLL